MFLVFGNKLKLILLERDDWKREAELTRSHLSMIQILLEDEREDRKRLTNIILKKFGMLEDEKEESKVTNFRPLGRAVQPWGKVRHKLEHKYSPSGVEKVNPVTHEELNKIIAGEK